MVFPWFCSGGVGRLNLPLRIGMFGSNGRLYFEHPQTSMSFVGSTET